MFFLIHMLATGLFRQAVTSLQMRSCKRQVTTGLILTDLLQLDEIDKFVHKLNQVGKVDNLTQSVEQVCVFLAT